MSNDLIIPEQLETLLLAHWADFVNKTALLRRVLEDARDANFKTVRKDVTPSPQTKISVTRFRLIDNNKFELWIEFSIPKEGGVAVGTHTYLLELGGSLSLQESYGVIFAV